MNLIPTQQFHQLNSLFNLTQIKLKKKQKRSSSQIASQKSSVGHKSKLDAKSAQSKMKFAIMLKISSKSEAEKQFIISQKDIVVYTAMHQKILLMSVCQNASNRLKVTKITEKCSITDRLTVVYDDSKKESKSRILSLPYFNDSKLFLITLRKSKGSGLSDNEVRYGTIDMNDLVNASNLYSRMMIFKQQQLRVQ